jgi:hypothetical protein
MVRFFQCTIHDVVSMLNFKLLKMRIEIHRDWMGFKAFPSYRVNGKYYRRLFFMWFATTLETRFKI